MSQESLRAVLDRVDKDEAFAQRLERNPTATLAEFDLSTVESVALSCADEDALRRLLGSSADAPRMDLAAFRDAAMPFFHSAARAELEELAGGTKTTQETSHGVTCCCW